MLTMAITWPPFTYITCSFLLFNLILENSSLLLNVESDKILLTLSSWVPSIVVSIAGVGVAAMGGVDAVVAGVVVVGVVVRDSVVVTTTKGSLCYYTSANQQS